MQDNRENNPRVIRRAELLRITGLSRSTQWRLERAGNFPRRIELTQGSVGWLLSEINEWIESCANRREGEQV